MYGLIQVFYRCNRVWNLHLAQLVAAFLLGALLAHIKLSIGTFNLSTISRHQVGVRCPLLTATTLYDQFKIGLHAFVFIQPPQKALRLQKLCAEVSCDSAKVSKSPYRGLRSITSGISKANGQFRQSSRPSYCGSKASRGMTLHQTSMIQCRRLATMLRRCICCCQAAVVCHLTVNIKGKNCDNLSLGQKGPNQLLPCFL